MAPEQWFAQRRFGVFVHMAIASVPAFSPVHEYAEWYWSHLSSNQLADVVLHPAPMPEVQDWHRRHYGDASYDDFVAELTLDRWDADEVAELIRAAGAGYVVHTAKHHDGYCFFDSALTDRTSMRNGPHRDPVAELAGSSRRAGLHYGLYYSLLDWAHPAYGTAAYVDEYLHPQVRELIERHAPAVLWGDGHWGRPPSYWRSDDIMQTYDDVVGAAGVVNDRWGASRVDFATFEYETPTEPPAGPFEVCRGVGYSFGWNRAERIDDHLTPTALIALLTETVAKGGNLLVDIGPRADGSIPVEQAGVLRAAGRWITANSDALDGTAPFEQWGDDTVRYTVSPSPQGADDLVRVNAIDLAGAARPRFAAITDERFELVDGPPDAILDRRGLTLTRTGDRADLAAVYRVMLRRRDAGSIRVAGDRAHATPAARIGQIDHATIAAALAAAQPGDVVEVADGVHTDEPFPLRVPPAVALRGHTTAVLDAGRRPFDAVVILDGDGAAIHGLTVRGVSARGFLQPATGVLIDGHAGVVVDGVNLVQASIVVMAAAAATVVANELIGGGIVVTGCRDIDIRHNRQRGNRWGSGITVEASNAVRATANELVDDLTGIRIAGTDDAVVTGNRVTTRWWGIHLDDATDATVARNSIERTMRAICVTAGRGHRISANTITGCDSGLLVEADAADVTTSDNSIVDCRLDVLTWSADPPVRHGDRVLRPRAVGPTDGDLGGQASGPGTSR